MFGHQYPCVRALWNKDLPPMWLPQIPSCNSSRSSSNALGCIHSKCGPKKEHLYNFWSSDSQNQGSFRRTLSPSDFSLGKISSLRKKNYGVHLARSHPNLMDMDHLILHLNSLHRFSTRITRGRLYAEKVASGARESAWVFPLLGMFCKLKESKPNCKCLTWLKYFYILMSLASNSP